MLELKPALKGIVKEPGIVKEGTPIGSATMDEKPSLLINIDGRAAVRKACAWPTLVVGVG